jgi:undecaprenyl-diphosphatase
MVEYILHLDQTIMKFVNTFAQHNHALDLIVVGMSSAHFLKSGIFVATLWWIWFSRKGGVGPGGVEGNRMFVVRSVAGGLVAIALGRFLQQVLPKRVRPMHDPQLGFQLPYGADPETLADWSSFPSDHALLFFALATAIWLWSRAWGTVAFIWALMVCMPRIYVGYHYPSDIIIGALLGVVTMLAVQHIPLPPGTFEPIRRYEAGHPAAFYTLAFVITYQISTLFSDVRRLGSGALIVLGMAG